VTSRDDRGTRAQWTETVPAAAHGFRESSPYRL
jgi:hypothetical protein